MIKITFKEPVRIEQDGISSIDAKFVFTTMVIFDKLTSLPTINLDRLFLPNLFKNIQSIEHVKPNEI